MKNLTPIRPRKITILALILIKIFLFEPVWATDDKNAARIDASSRSGFYLPEPYDEASIRYTDVNSLIIVQVVINGNLPVNLILDTGTRNLVLFGKRFEKFFQFVPEKIIQFSGMGSGKPVYGKLSIGNRVVLTSVIGEQIPIVVVSEKNIFNTNAKIDGIIGYDIFQRFEVEINPMQKQITFRPSTSRTTPDGYTQVPLRMENTKPIIDSKILLEGGRVLSTGLMIDTGSQLSVLIKTTNDALFDSKDSEVLGKGMSGKIEGINTMTHTLSFAGINFYEQPTGIILSPWHNYGSIGMGLLKEYAIIINYNGAYACLKKLES